MFKSFKEWLIRFVTSRFFLLSLLFLGLGSILIYRLFDLQIVNGESYLNNFKLKIRKERTIASTRGKIYDSNGNLLAYNELAYSVTIEDVYESGSSKNDQLNGTILKLIRIIESNGDKLLQDFNIELDTDGNFVYKVSGTALLRFLADVYGHSYISDLLYAEKTASPREVIEYLAGTSKFGIGEYLTDENGEYILGENGKKQFVVGKGYTDEELLKIINIRYAISLNSYQKYIATTVAVDVSTETIATVMENSDILDGVSIAEDTVRKYNDAVYFSNIIGYTGRISPEELALYQEADDDFYSNNDIIGKSGIEQSMELQLRGVKGNEVVYVDNRGGIIETSDLIEPIAGNDIYLTINSDLQKAIYHILEQKIASILVSKIINAKTYTPKENASAASIQIPIYDVYFALFDNNILKMRDFNSIYATETQSSVYANYVDNMDDVLLKLRRELTENSTVYNKLLTEYQIYESYIISVLMSDNVNILQSDLIDTNDSTYKAWRTDETISLQTYLKYTISQNWIDTTKLDLPSQYADTDEIYSALVDFILDYLSSNTEFGKKTIKYMILGDKITGKQICRLLIDGGIVVINDSELVSFENGKISAYQFMINRITNLDITPAQLALDPCTGDIVVTDVNSGNVLAMVSYPGYDINRVADTNYWNKINYDKSYPMLNYTTQRRTAPGSTFKMVTASAALEEGYISPTTKISCLGIFEKQNSKNKCWIYPGAHGSINVSSAIRHSCNYFFYDMGYELSMVNGVYNEEVGIEKLTKYADLFGLTERSGVEVDEYTPKVSDEFPIVSAIGQGNSNYTTSQLARYVTTIANSGTCYNLTLIDYITDSDGLMVLDNHAEVRNILDFKDSTWNALHTGMRQVVQDKAYFNDLGVSVAGKTGTAQESKARPNHALFVCYAPYEAPEIAIATRIEYGYASNYAAETTKDVLMYYFELAEYEDIITGTSERLESSGVNTD